jgi:alkanesulfonate monooxygenase SsuD/methylene tetrahydromethanopterin reductase-like flavin-dependent oxidoreductase (luciferase family)
MGRRPYPGSTKSGLDLSIRPERTAPGKRVFSRSDNDPVIRGERNDPIKLAVGVFVLPLRNPFATAKAVATLDLLSKGRFIFGIGIGWLAEEFRAVGMNFSDRSARNAEYLALMEELWNSENPVFKGPTVEANGFLFMPKPKQKPTRPWCSVATPMPR